MGLAVLVSITAEAEQEPLQGASVFERARMVEAAGGLDRAVRAARTLRAVNKYGEPLPIVQARFVVGDPDDLAPSSGETEPNGPLKRSPQPYPAVGPAAKGDPFGEDPRDAEFDPGHTMSPGRPDDGGPPPAERPGLAFDDGATPGPPLEFALNSSSPISSDGVLVVVEIDPTHEATAPQLSAVDGKPNYAALIDPKDNARQMRCLAEAIYFESRSEPEDGQAAVAQVVLNRVRSGIYPTTVCGVVYQDRNRPFACQFTFACEGKSLRIEEPGPWAVATRIATEVVSGQNYNAKVGEAVNYHANYVSPFWVGYLRKVDRIGAHIFYAMRDGVNWAPGALNGNGDRPPIAN
jgi:hypothetical protein